MPIYVIQRRYQTELTKKVGGALTQMFQHINGESLCVNEAVAEIEAPTRLSQKNKQKLCAHLLNKAKEEGDTETISFECVPYDESISAKAGGNR